MKNRTVIILLATLTATILLFTGCEKKDAEPVVSEIVEEIEEAEPVDETEPVEEVETAEPTEVSNGEYNGAGEDVEVDGEVVGGSTLTQEEIEELKASATTSNEKLYIDIYEQITQNGSYTDEYGTLSKAVGKPDGSWRRMTDAEAQAIIAQGEDAEGYYAAEAELESSSSIWCYMDDRTGTVYYDYYAWLDSDASKPADTGSDYKDGEDLKRDNPELYDRLMKFDR